MPQNLFQDGTDENNENLGPVGSKDSYSDRFEVIQRASGTKPRSPIINKSGHLKSSDRLFSRHRDRNGNFGGRVNMKNVNPAINKEEANNSADEEAVKVDQTTQSIDEPVKQDSSTNKEKNSELESLRSSGLDSLFSSTSKDSAPDDDKSSKKDARKTNKIKKNFNDKEDNNSSSDAFCAKSDDKPLSNSSPKRKVTVIKPITFNSSASELSNALKSDDVVVLCIKHSDVVVGMRVLDFAFGCASITGAQVSMGADRTYIFTKGPKISDEEKLECMKHGVTLKHGY